MLAAHVTPANEQERAQVKEPAQAVQDVTKNSVEVAFVDQGSTGPLPERDAKEAGIELIVVKLPEAKKGFVLLPRRWAVERSFAWTTRFRGLDATLSERQKPSAACISLSLLSLYCITSLDQSLMSSESA